MSLNRRNFIAGSAAIASTPALGAVSASGETDVAIIGAGAAGIAAARKVAAAGRRFVLIEAGERIGGRCFTETTTFGVPYDRGAHWVHVPELNPVAKLATRASGFDVYNAPPGQKLRITRRNAREGEMEDYLAAIVRANRAIQDASRGKADVSCAQALPKDLGDWRPAIEFVLGPFGCGKNLDEISAIDFARSAERDADAYCRQGFGALVAKLGADLPVQLRMPVTRMQSTRNFVEIETARGRINARAAILTVSTGVLAAEKIAFTPALPKRQIDAIAKLLPGSYDHVALELKSNLQLRNDDLVFEKAANARTAALLANVSGTPLAMVEIAGKFGAELARGGTAAMTDFAMSWLTDLFGADVKKSIGKTHATRWSADPLALGAFSVAAVGGQPGRKILMEPVRERLFFAGEAVHETLWGTVGGAWEFGERAAEAALKLWGRETMTRPKALIAWSSGKDSAWALHEVRRAGEYDIVGALTTITETFNRVSMHGVREDILRAQHAAIGLPPVIVPIPYPCPNEVYEARMAVALDEAKRAGVTHVIFGDLFLEDVRAYREQKLAGTGIAPLFPLWQRPTDALAREMIGAGVETYLVCVDLKQLPKSFAGRRFDASLLADLPPGVDPCGEKGEFHSCVVAGPMFSRRIDVTVGETIERDGFAYTDILIPPRAAGRVAAA